MPDKSSVGSVITIKFRSFGNGFSIFGERTKLAEVPNLAAKVLISFGPQSSSGPSMVLFGMASIPVPSTEFHLWASFRTSNPKFCPQPQVPSYFDNKVSLGSSKCQVLKDTMARKHIDRWPRVAWKLERTGTPKVIPNSTYTQHVTRVLEEIHMTFSPLFIYHAFWFFVSMVTIDLHQGNLIQWLRHPRLVNFSAASRKESDQGQGSFTALFLSAPPREGVDSHIVAIKAITFTFKTKYGKGASLYNQ